ncbi:hypothetical protein [Massilia genomosp. 1]|uniref:hypothetical protein n=1 Tax=Massilia genomosp. 1 TaxID=2609280 RepID=UPI001420ABBF|nr:hypothetical protein [Massilia genomosp. 1]
MVSLKNLIKKNRITFAIEAAVAQAGQDVRLAPSRDTLMGSMTTLCATMIASRCPPSSTRGAPSPAACLALMAKPGS